MDRVADAFNMANTLSTVSFCFAILASIAAFPPDIGLPKASSISLRPTAREEGHTGQSTFSIIFTDLSLKSRRPSCSSMSIVRVMLFSLRDTIVLLSAYFKMTSLYKGHDIL